MTLKYIIKMESNNKLQEISIKNRAYDYFDEIIKFEDFDIYILKMKNNTKIS